MVFLGSKLGLAVLVGYRNADIHGLRDHFLSCLLSKPQKEGTKAHGLNERLTKNGLSYIFLGQSQAAANKTKGEITWTAVDLLRVEVQSRITCVCL